jgi:hypothetical protein
MLKNLNKFKFIFLFSLSFILMSWGYSGHHKINESAVLSFNPEMEQFLAWTTLLGSHASDADYRKDTDPYESPRHYIDIDEYQEFIQYGRIPQTYDSVVDLYGQSFVIDQGILPWATIKAYDSLRNCFQRRDWTKAVLFAADLGHYVADGHMPMHITRNYDGQYSNNDGIHSRYESSMINAYIGQFDYEGYDISAIADVNAYIFNYLYANYVYVDSVLAADDYARGIAGNTSSALYKQTLWAKTSGFTIPLFKHGSHALAELIYTAWSEAGKPLINETGIFDPNKSQNILHLQVFPNPVKESAIISFIHPVNSSYRIQLLSINGEILETRSENNQAEGTTEITWDTGSLSPGVYFFSIETGNSREIRKVVKL